MPAHRKNNNRPKRPAYLQQARNQLREQGKIGQFRKKSMREQRFQGRPSLAKLGLNNPSRYQRSGPPVMKKTIEMVQRTGTRNVMDVDRDWRSRTYGKTVTREIPYSEHVPHVVGLKLVHQPVRRLHKRSGGSSNSSRGVGVVRVNPTVHGRARKALYKRAAGSGKKGQRPKHEEKKKSQKH